MQTTSDVVTLWRPTGQAELDLVAASGWRAWPPRLPEQPIFYPVLNRWYAIKIARKWNVPVDGAGFVTRFDVRREFLDRYEPRRAGGRDALEYWIPAEDLAALNANIIGAITEEADYRGPVPDAEFARAADALGRPLPQAWRDYLQGPAWFRRGWLPSGHYVWLYPPRETLDALEAWGDGAAAHPGAAIIGGDGSREQLVLDMRHEETPVLSADVTGTGWEHAVRQADDVARFIERIEDGTFEFVLT